jgi:UDP-2,3-diacylglucosamine pyrophosphatase LpxH
MGGDLHNLLVISDLHLGEDLFRLPDGRSAPGAEVEADPTSPYSEVPLGSAVEQTERALVAFIVHYTQFRMDGRPWRLVINGDMLDFLRVAISPDEEGLEATDVDRLYGFGATPMAAKAKLRRVYERHAAFFEALARFVGRGNELHMVVGNHDAELHWEEVQNDVASEIDRLWTTATGEASIRDRIVFHTWFLYEPGVAWIEHGHQYDAFCSFEDPLIPEDTDNPKTLEENLGTAAMRYLGNHLPVEPDATNDLSFIEYLALIWNARNDDVFKFVWGYWEVVRTMGKQWLKRVRNPGKYLERRKLRKARMAAIAAKVGLTGETLQKLHKLRRPPAFVSFFGFIRSVMLGRLVTTVGLVAVIPLAVLVLPWLWSLSFALFATGIVLAVHVWLETGRDDVDPTDHMRKVAGQIRKISKAPVVVFGHSHVPLAHRLPGRGWYFNTGAWAGGSERPYAFTHLIVERTPDGARSALCRWEGGQSRELRAEVTSTRRPLPHLSAGY